MPEVLRSDKLANQLCGAVRPLSPLPYVQKLDPSRAVFRPCLVDSVKFLKGRLSIFKVLNID